MTEYPANRGDWCPPHPGALLRDLLPEVGKSKTEIARLLGISRQQLHDVLEERRPISPAMAARFGKLLGNGARIWVALQADHDAWHAERETDTSKIPTLTGAA